MNRSSNLLIISIVLITTISLTIFFVTNSKNDYKNPEKFGKLAKSLYVDFDTSMQIEKYSSKAATNKPLIDFFRTSYENNSFKNVMPKEKCNIPKIFHYIWLGKKLPEQYDPFLQTWLKYHPDWTFIFWVDNPKNYYLGEIKDFNLDSLKKYIETENISNKRIVIDIKNINFENKTFFDSTRNYGQRSDILRWEVLYRFGGVYIDVDFECIKPLDILHYTYDFYTGIQPLDTSFIQLGAALLGTIPNHPILQRCVETIKEDWKYPQIILSTGPLHFTKCFYEAFMIGNFVNIALPASYFYPCGYEEQRLPRKNWIRPESFAAHHWAGSWLKPEGWDPKNS